MKEERRDKDCFPLPPTPTSNAWPPGFLIILAIRLNGKRRRSEEVGGGGRRRGENGREVGRGKRDRGERERERGKREREREREKRETQDHEDLIRVRRR